MENNVDTKSEILFQLDDLMPVIRESLREGKTVRFSPRGTSMLPLLRQGVDNVILSPLPEKLKKYDIPLYQRDNGQYVLHRIVEANGSSYTCIGDNQFDMEYDVRYDQMIAVTSGFVCDGKEHTVGEFGYQLYCRLWHYSRLPRRCLRYIKNRLRRHSQ